MTTNIEKEIKEIHTYAQRYADELHRKGHTKDPIQPEVKISVCFEKNYFGERLGVMAIGNCGATLVHRGCSGKNTPTLLRKMKTDLKQEYETFLDTGMVPSIGGCRK